MKMKTFKISAIALFAGTLVACGGGAEETSTTAPADTVPAEDTTAVVDEPVANDVAAIDHSSWDALLQKHVSAEGNVNYEAFMEEMDAVVAYTDMLKANAPSDEWSREEQMCYWINAYNAFTVQLILENYPIESIMDIDGGKPWDREWIAIGDKTYSLNNLENDILRPTYQDARVHFAINCASYSCPMLWNQAFTPENLEGQLEVLAKGFVNDPKRNAITADAPQISSIFDWYKDDFITDGTVIDFLNKYADTQVNSDATIGYMEYNWSLNK